MSIEIEENVLKKACMEMIETILFCLPNAFKGTIYRVGKMPDLIVERITSGIVNSQGKEISWGLPAQSEYNPPGKHWVDYRDEPGRRPLEAMAWCVEKQKSWTAEDPAKDSRSVSLQVEVGLEDFQHMEPVLVRKSDLGFDMYPALHYPRNYINEIVWQDTDYIVVAVIKIHFRPYTIKINSDETRVIKKLSRLLGTELLSYQLRQESMNAMQELARDRLNACNILADSLRNAITKFGLVFTLVKQEIGFLREQWETTLLGDHSERNLKQDSIDKLNEILLTVEDCSENFRKVIIDAHSRFLELSLPPDQGRNWIEMQIESRWIQLMNQYEIIDDRKAMILEAIKALKTSLDFGQDPGIIAEYNKISKELKNEWIGLIYKNTETISISDLDRLIKILENAELNIPSRERSRKTFIQLKALAETMSQLEDNTNFLLHQVLNGHSVKNSNGRILDILKNTDPEEVLSFKTSLRH